MICCIFKKRVFIIFAKRKSIFLSFIYNSLYVFIYLIYLRFPSSKYPVYAFKGAPGSFPSNTEHHSIQKYLHFSDMLENIADDYIRKEMEGKPFLAIHLRNGKDMVCI